MRSTRLTCLLIGLVCALIAGCGGNASPPDNIQPAIYEARLSGSISDVSSTDAALGNSAARLVNAQQLPAGATGWVTDVAGNRLADFTVNPDGAFEATNLPAGVDLVINVDIDGDGRPDVQTIVNIPREEGGNAGQLNEVVVDPLSTLSCAKLAELLLAGGIDPQQLDLSLSALIERIRDAFENLSADSGIDMKIELSNILGVAPEQLGPLFDALIPAGAQRGMRMFQGNIALAAATDVQGVVKAVAAILLEGGFVIADTPGGADLSFLGSLPNIRATTFDEYHREMLPESDQQPPPPPPGVIQPTLYISTVAEPDRNFANSTEKHHEGPRTIFNEHVLVRMAQAYLDGRTITLGQLHRLLVDADTGLGIRLMYPAFRGPNTPPVEVFETPDGAGTERNMQDLFAQIHAMGLDKPDPQTFEARKAQLRALLTAFLTGTAEPSFERLFGGFLMDRVPSADAVARDLRQRRAHLPFSRTGPAQLFVVASADSFRDPSAQPIRVSVDVDAGGQVVKVRSDPAGKFYVGFGPNQGEDGMLCQLVSAANGRMLHDHKGRPQFVEIADRNIFEDIGGKSFLETVSERGNNYPGAPALEVTNWGFDPTKPEDPRTNPRNFQIFVLMTQPGPDGVPVRVDYNDGTAVLNLQGGAYYMMFDPETVNGKFGLVKETGEFLAATPGDFNTRVLITPQDVQGLPPVQDGFLHIFGIQVANPAYDPAGAPYYDDINNNGTEDPGEPTFSNRHFLGNPNDWRSTFVEQYYRKASDNGFPSAQDIDWGSDTPRMRSGDPLVPRNFRPRLNAFLFGRPNVAVNLLMAFNPPDFFDGTHAFNADTKLNPFTVLALVSLVTDGLQNVEAYVDFDGPGPMQPHRELVRANYFIPPVGDPVELLISGFGQLVGD